MLFNFQQVSDSTLEHVEKSSDTNQEQKQNPNRFKDNNHVVDCSGKITQDSNNSLF